MAKLEKYYGESDEDFVLRVQELQNMKSETDLSVYNIRKIFDYLRLNDIQISETEIKNFDSSEVLENLEGTQIRRRFTGEYNSNGDPKYEVTVIHNGQILFKDLRQSDFGVLNVEKDLGLSRDFLYNTVNEGDTRQNVTREKVRGSGRYETTRETVVWNGSSWVAEEEYTGSTTEDEDDDGVVDSEEISLEDARSEFNTGDGEVGTNDLKIGEGEVNDGTDLKIGETADGNDLKIGDEPESDEIDLNISIEEPESEVIGEELLLSDANENLGTEIIEAEDPSTIELNKSDKLRLGSPDAWAATPEGEYYTYNGKRYKKGSVTAQRADIHMANRLRAQEMARERLRIKEEATV